MYELVRACALAAGVPERLAHPHALRTYRATALLEDGASLGVLLVGWSGVEGFGAVLVVPAIAALTAASYEGQDRALAYALLGGISAVAIAAGPLIGGWVTTELSWRYVFAAETVVVIFIVLLRGESHGLQRPLAVPVLTS